MWPPDNIAAWTGPPPPSRSSTAALDSDRQHLRHSPGGDLDTAAFSTAVASIMPLVTDALQAAPNVDADSGMDLVRAQVTAWAQHQMRSGRTLSAATQARLARAVYEELFGLGPLTRYVDDPAVENIDINGADRVWISYRDGRTEQGPAVAASNDELIGKIQRWSAYKASNPREFSFSHPLMNAALGEHVRLSASMSVTPYPCVSVRVHRHVNVTLADLVKVGTVDPALEAFLRAAVRARKDIIVSGGTGAGKTTLLRALAAEIDPDERIATLETDRELFLHTNGLHHNVIAFEARAANSEGVGEITLHQLIPQTLRHNPKRIIVGEVRADEAWPMLAAMNSGHEGSLCTLHANSAEEVFPRLLILSRSGGLDLQASDLHMMVGMAVDFVVHLSRDAATNHRYISEVIEVLPPADAPVPGRNYIFRPGPDGRAVPTTVRPQCEDDLVAAGFDPAAMRMPRRPLNGHRAGTGGVW
ncbi:ATPase, T2SS/T4P/T4SS family (plasmid) [Nonomuraea sp. NBC_00507]|uniref:CpaF family protein n=1 Tax=Nonomuraea sp. NBC_00507 TaxID=2976002 RepID=UPI002E19CB00